MTSVRPGMKDEDIALERGWVLFSGAWVNVVPPGVKGEAIAVERWWVLFSGGWVLFVRPGVGEDGVVGEFCSSKDGG